MTSTEEEFVIAALLVDPPLFETLVELPPEDVPEFVGFPAGVPEDPTLTTCPTEITTFVYVVPLTMTDGIESSLVAGL